MKARLAINQMMVRELPLENLMAWCSRNRVEGIGLLATTLDRYTIPAIRGMLVEHNLQLTSVCVALGLVAMDPAARRRKLLEAERLLIAARQLDVPLVVVVGGPGPDLAMHDARKMALAGLNSLHAIAEVSGAELLVEPLHPALVEMSALTTLDDAADFIRGTSGVGLVLDTWHMWTDWKLSEAVHNHRNLIKIVHLADWKTSTDKDRAIPGTGIADLQSIIDVLNPSTFAGWWELEVIIERSLDPPEAYALLDRSLSATRMLLRCDES